MPVEPRQLLHDDVFEHLLVCLRARQVLVEVTRTEILLGDGNKSPAIGTWTRAWRRDLLKSALSISNILKIVSVDCAQASTNRFEQLLRKTVRHDCASPDSAVFRLSCFIIVIRITDVYVTCILHALKWRMPWRHGLTRMFPPVALRADTWQRWSSCPGSSPASDCARSKPPKSHASSVPWTRCQ